MSEPSDEELLRAGGLAMKELLRQFRQMQAMLPEGDLGDYSTHELFQNMRELLKGKLDLEQFEAETDRLGEEIAAAAREEGDPVQLTIIDSDNEAEAKQLPLAARLLARNATRRAAVGLSKEQWIAEVLSGHSSDEDAQLACLSLIVGLWADGPWPWPRTYPNGG